MVETQTLALRTPEVSWPESHKRLFSLLRFAAQLIYSPLLATHRKSQGIRVPKGAANQGHDPGSSGKERAFVRHNMARGGEEVGRSRTISKILQVLF